MADTPNLKLRKPTVGGQETNNTWGLDLNQNFDTIDSVLGPLPDRITELEKHPPGGGMVEEPPVDGKIYGRRDEDWAVTGTISTSPPSGGVDGDVWYQVEGPAETTLNALTLSNSTILENSVAGTVVGAVQGKTSGSTLSLTGTAGSRFALSGANVVAGSVATDFETAASHNITLRETLSGATNSPRDTTLPITVTDVAEGGGGIGPFTLTWTSPASERTDLAFSITPTLLEDDSVTIAFDNDSNMSSPLDTSDANVIDAGEATAGSITFTGLTLPLPADVVTYARANVVRGGENADTNIVSKTLYDQIAFTSAPTVNAVEEVPFAHTLTADQAATFSILPGEQGAGYEISGSTLRNLANANTRTYAPGGDNSDNVIVRATATAAPANTVDQSITVTVTDVGAPAWTPASEGAALRGWWKDAGITEASDVVTAWADQSGNGVTLTPWTGGDGPSRNATDDTAYNGLAALAFDRISQNLSGLRNSSAAALSGLGANMTFAWQGTVNDDPGQAYGYIMAFLGAADAVSGGATGSFSLLFRDAVNAALLTHQGGTTSSSFAIPYATPMRIVITCGGGTVTVYLNEVVAVTLAKSFTLDSTGTFCLGSGVVSTGGVPERGTTGMRGYCREAFILNRTASAADITDDIGPYMQDYGGF